MPGVQVVERATESHDWIRAQRRGVMQRFETSHCLPGVRRNVDDRQTLQRRRQ